MWSASWQILRKLIPNLLALSERVRSSMRARGCLVGVIGLSLPLVAACTADPATRALDVITSEALDAHLRFLASDELEGRAPGSRGSRLAALYIATQFELAGLEPAVGDSSFIQPVALVSALPRPTLSFRARGGARFAPTYGTEFVAWSAGPVDSTRVESELVFVGYGISAPEYDWDDYREEDVSGKMLLMLVNDPGRADPDRFRGDTLTYYGRWTYKLEEARRRGASGALLVHTSESAGYGWNVIESSWTGEQITLQSEVAASEAPVEGWLAQSTAEQVLAMGGLDFATLLESSVSPEFRPIATGITVSARVRSRVRSFLDANVAGLLRGGDDELSDELVVVTSHYDHLGMGGSRADSIYNGAYDNASGTALLINLAQAFARLPERPARSVLFLAVTAEESGLLGSGYYVRHPLFPLTSTVANINVDGANLWGRTKDVVVIGAEESSLEEIVAGAARAEGLRLSGDRAPEQGYLFRSDQFSFMKAGVPVAYIDHGLDFIGQMPGWGEQLLEEYNALHYHQPSDEYKTDFDLSGAVQQSRVAFRVVLAVANAAGRPTWNDDSLFKEARDSVFAAAPATN